MAHMDSIRIILPYSLLRLSKKLNGADRVCGGSYGCPCMYAGVCLHIYIYIYIDTYMYNYVCMCLYMYIYIHVWQLDELYDLKGNFLRPNLESPFRDPQL